MVNTSRQPVNTFEDGGDDDDDHDEYENQKKTVISLAIIKATGIKLGKETYVIVRLEICNLPCSHRNGFGQNHNLENMISSKQQKIECWD